MRIALAAFGVLVMAASAAQADSQSSNSSSNTSSNNGVVRDRMVETYCENGYCQRFVSRRTYRDDRRRGYRQDDRRYYQDRRHYRDRRYDRDDDD